MPTKTTTDKTSSFQGEAREGRITAIVPARNERDVIAACVRALAQQEQIAEILVVDDQSVDGTAEVIRGLLLEIPRLRLVAARGSKRRSDSR